MKLKNKIAIFNFEPLEEKQSYCVVHYKSFTQQSFILPSGKIYIKECDKCEKDKQNKRSIEKQKDYLNKIKVNHEN